MKKKIFRSLILISVMVLLLSSIISTSFLHSYFNREQTAQLHIELELVADAVNELGWDYLNGVEDDTYRFTIIDDKGQVIYDTKADAKTMENHADREEVIEAFQSGNGRSARTSSTLTTKTFYEAVKLDNGTVLRVAVEQLALGGAFLKVLPMNLLIALIATILALVVSNRVAGKITEPLLMLDLEHPTENDTYEELSFVLTKIHHQHQQLAQQMDQLKQKNDELNQIISSMSEGLIILNRQGLIVAMNASAKTIFNAKDDTLGNDFLTLDRSYELSQAIEEAKKESHAEVSLNKNGREYQCTISRIQSEETVIGTLILCFDITEKAFAERNRQEFTANVSHELKTPLQGIIGSAELLENGLVKPEDTALFISNIKNEATRLVSLINDIIRLSQLDERSEVASEKVDLTAILNEVIKDLTPLAEKKNVTFLLNGEHVMISGIPRYIYEIFYNICDNAIRYNKEGGKVDVTVKDSGKNAEIVVSDTGIGIPIEHQARIFERFYRVDKSHSKKTGGTGLGLSIVKRAVMIHNGKVSLESTPNEGTTVTVLLPR